MKNDYYDRHGQEFSQATKDLEMTELHAPFLALVPTGGFILDAGCGSGRDLKLFAAAGYKTMGIDSSPEMVRLAQEHSGQPVEVMTFQEIEFADMFDGIWACASLLHVPDSEFDNVLSRLARALRRGGVLYMSFKYGTTESTRNGRLFNDFTEEKLNGHLAAQSGLELMHHWVTDDVRPGRSEEKWLNVLVRKARVASTL